LAFLLEISEGMTARGHGDAFREVFAEAGGADALDNCAADDDPAVVLACEALCRI
jgi:hypothetical protein